MLDHTAESWAATTLHAIKSPGSPGDWLRTPQRPGESVRDDTGEKQVR
jgi:hypothetical protein